MSFWDSVKKITRPYADDDYDDYDEDEEETDDQYEESEARPSRTRRTRRSAPAPTPAPVREEEPEEDEADFTFDAPTIPASPSSSSGSGFSGSVLSMNSSSSSSNSNKQEVVLFRPNSFSDTSKAADDLRSRRAVIVNMENVDKELARRVVDFLSGCVYALDGDVKKIAQSAYLFTPHNMNIVGDLGSIQAEVESYM